MADDADDNWKARLKLWALTPVASLARGLGSTRLGLLLPVATFAGLSTELTQRPQDLAEPIVIDFKLPSEAAIPPSVAVRPVDEANDPVWRFRYAETGTEFRSGIPYWIFRIMPKIFDEVFHGEGYEHFGFTADDTSYYSSRPVPRGMALSDTVLRSSLLKLRFAVKRVSINCSGCHRGEYLDSSSRRTLVDGMPNHTANLQEFKRFFASAFQNPKFQAGRVITEIDKALAEEGHAPLTAVEEAVYRGLVALLKQMTRERASAWMDAPRADNGPGRIDPFNAVKFEVLKVPDDGTVATLDFPSVWNQRAEIRPWHHFDGNTDESSARNYGSVIGVGGIPSSVNKESVSKIGAWFDVVPPPRYPFTPPEPASVARGATAFQHTCASCHAVYDRKTNTIDAKGSPLYMQIDLKVGTDPERWKAFLEPTANALNGYGAVHSLWKWNSFRGSKNPGGYLCGPLDGVWARAPYLHNGSVPTIAELLKPADERVKIFYRGNRHYDEAAMGWVHDQKADGDRALFEYDTSHAGNRNEGHPYTVPPDERADLIEYLKTL